MSHPKCVVGSELGCFARAVSTLGRLSLLSRPLKEEFFFKVTEEMKTSCCVLSASWDTPIGWWPQHLSTGHPVADNGISMPLPSCFLPCSHSVVSTPEHRLLGEASWQWQSCVPYWSQDGSFCTTVWAWFTGALAFTLSFVLSSLHYSDTKCRIFLFCFQNSSQVLRNSSPTPPILVKSET